MASPDSSQRHGEVVGEPVSPWAIGAIVLAILAVLAASGVVITTMADSDRGSLGGGIALGGPARAGTEVLTELPPPEGEEPGDVLPSGRVAYITADGRVLVGTGAAEPEQVATDAAIGNAGLGAVEIAPTSDLLAYVRADGALVALPVSGGEPLVLANDVALDAIGHGPVLSWNPTGTEIAYLAAGTEDMARPRPETPPRLSSPEVHRVPLPEGAIGNVLKIVDRTGRPVAQIGDPSLRSMVGVESSQADDMLILESVAPDTQRPYTLMITSSSSPEEVPTILSADDPAFSPDGNFLIAVGPDKSGQELLRIETDQLARSTLVSRDRICNPSVSPDSSRIVYGTGEGCSRLHLISSRGGQPVDITPPARPGDADYSTGALGWTPEGRYITFADCRSTDGPVRCGGNVTFLDPDHRLVIPGPEASTVAPVRQPLLQNLQLDLVLAGPIQYETSFPIDATAEGELDQLGERSGLVELRLTEDDREVHLRLQIEKGAQFATGQLTITDPTKGIDRTVMVLGAPSVLGIRVVSLSGVWISTDDLPFTSGEFRLAVRRR